MNERSILGIFTSQHSAEPASRRGFGSTGIAGRQGMAEPGSSALHLLSTPAHLMCPAPISSHYYSCLSSWMGNDAVPIPTGSCWGGRGRKAWDEGKGQHSREEKDAGAADPWLTEGRDRNLHPCRGTSPGGKMLSKHLSLAASPGKAFAAVHERCLPCDTDTFSPQKR